MVERVVLLAGASGGIGSRLAKMLSGHTVVSHYFRHKPDHEGPMVCADITDAGAVERMVAEVLAKHGRIDILINASGISLDGFTHKMPAETWQKVVDVNLTGAFNLAHAVLPSMRANEFGRIVLLSSVVSQRAVMGTPAYSATKAALAGLTKTVALENVTKGITCNCIALGYFDAGLLHQLSDDWREQIRQSIPMKRFGRVEEIYRTIDFLVNTDYVTGQVICVNGGLFMA